MSSDIIYCHQDSHSNKSIMNKTNLELDHIAKPFEKIIHGLIFLYILTIPLQSIGFKFTELFVGLPEIVFLVLAPLAIIYIMRSGQKLWIDSLDLFVFGWLLANILAGWHAGFDSIVVTVLLSSSKNRPRCFYHKFHNCTG